MRNFRPRAEYVPDGQLARCKSCGEDITWMFSSKRTGKQYPTNTLVDSTNHALVSCKTWFHKCDGQKADHGQGVMRAKFRGTCSACGGRIEVGQAIMYDRTAVQGKKVRHGLCATQAGHAARLTEKVDPVVAQLMQEAEEDGCFGHDGSTPSAPSRTGW